MRFVRAVFALPGYWLATALALIWGAPLARFRVARHGDLLVCAGLPRWAFGRGGTTIGAVYLTHGSVGEAVLRHEAVHRQQWRRYGLAFIVLYVAAGRDPLRNRFEIEAGLEDGGYRRRAAPAAAPTGAAPTAAPPTTAAGADAPDAPAPTAPPAREDRPPRPGAR
ncbi:hypothetical protein [Chryseoglobus sp. 28M-23]|uniref:hypothetical protein n=1 Tax=Chryseoglobus sp. 28M-23 TaxID=2772253 RepID=UPI001747573F|nr:hypothetical protein [Chryseoglobus sp. 28M-23]QOD94446.1 hypothetical protein IE160_04350 [Chryseoglobus sp. 28M-23]